MTDSWVVIHPLSDLSIPQSVGTYRKISTGILWYGNTIIAGTMFHLQKKKTLTWYFVFLMLFPLRTHFSGTIHILFLKIGIRKKLVVPLIMLHINNDDVVFSKVDSSSQTWLNVALYACLRYVHDIPRREHVLAPTIIAVSLAVWGFNFWHFYLTFFHFVSSAFSFFVGACGL
jgi:uncharacterized membrane protein